MLKNVSSRRMEIPSHQECCGHSGCGPLPIGPHTRNPGQGAPRSYLRHTPYRQGGGGRVAQTPRPCVLALMLQPVLLAGSLWSFQP